MKKHFLLFFFIFTQVLGQKIQEDLVPVTTEGSDRIYIDAKGIDNFTGDDIFVWVSFEHSNPIVIESIEDKIAKTKSYYLFNKSLLKYSILFIIYYDENNNVLASYDYSRKSDIEAYQYNYPIWKNSDEALILEKCLELIALSNAGTK